ncbi:MAG: YdeI/OmpD-associated family protein [Burkholderiaceae bacterium]
MNPKLRINFTAKLERKDPKLPVYVVVPYADAVGLRLQATTVIEGTVNGQSIGRRSIKRWDSSVQSPWFVEFTAPFCRSSGIAVGDQLNIALWRANTELPEELEKLLQEAQSIRAAWDCLPDYSRRTHAEHIRAGKSEVTRSRRAAAVVASINPLGQLSSNASNTRGANVRGSTRKK